MTRQTWRALLAIVTKSTIRLALVVVVGCTYRVPPPSVAPAAQEHPRFVFKPMLIHTDRCGLADELSFDPIHYNASEFAGAPVQTFKYDQPTRMTTVAAPVNYRGCIGSQVLVEEGLFGLYAIECTTPRGRKCKLELWGREIVDRR